MIGHMGCGHRPPRPACMRYPAPPQCLLSLMGSWPRSAHTALHMPNVPVGSIRPWACLSRCSGMPSRKAVPFNPIPDPRPSICPHFLKKNPPGVLCGKDLGGVSIEPFQTCDHCVQILFAWPGRDLGLAGVVRRYQHLSNHEFFNSGFGHGFHHILQMGLGRRRLIGYLDFRGGSDFRMPAEILSHGQYNKVALFVPQPL